jgi:hypothetical protein
VLVVLFVKLYNNWGLSIYGYKDHKFQVILVKV